MDFVSYIRVSTAQQGTSGLGLEAQREAIAAHVTAKGGTLIAEFQEIESGKRSRWNKGSVPAMLQTQRERPQLAAAMAAARKAGATLIVAKLDRLSRNVAFLSALAESDVDFIALDLPAANKFTLHVMAAVAEQEADAISKRTSAALQAKKKRGDKLGSPVPMADSVRAAGRARRTENARAHYATAGTIAMLMRNQGASLGAIAAKLNTLRDQLTPARGGNWHPAHVQRAIRYASEVQ